MAEVFSSPFLVRQLVSGDLNFDGICRPRGSGAEDREFAPVEAMGKGAGIGYETCHGSVLCVLERVCVCV